VDAVPALTSFVAAATRSTQMDPLFATALVGGLALGVLFMVAVIAVDKTRYLARFDLAHFNERVYLSLLPNFLQHLHDRGFRSPWPWRMDAVAAAYFRHQVRAILAEKPRLRRANFVHLHLNLQALLTMLKPFIDDAVLAEQAKLAAERALGMPDTADRDRLLRFVDRVRAYRAAFIGSLTVLDRRLIREVHERDFLGTLKSANAMFHEHGFDDPIPAMDVLRRWHALEGTEMVQELPALPRVPARGAAAHTSLLPQVNPGDA
jgi:hypothetical protein